MKLFGLRSAALLVLAFVSLVATPLAGVAQELSPEQLALARQYVDLTDKSGIYEVALVSVGVETMRTILTLHPDIRDPVDKAITKTLESYKARKGELMDQFARLYAMRFTMDELKAIVEFYSSPVGVKLSTVNANMSQDLQAVMKVWETNLKGEFFAKVRAELKAAGIDT